MEQRQHGLGDVLDDYCPRERRVTNHAVVALVGDEIKLTRCTTCDTEHPYKAARVPPRRQTRLVAALSGAGAAGAAPALQGSASADPAAPEAPPDPPPPVTSAAPSPVDSVRRPLIRATLERADGVPPLIRQPTVFTIREAANRDGGPRRAQRPGGNHQGQPNGNRADGNNAQFSWVGQGKNGSRPPRQRSANHVSNPGRSDRSGKGRPRNRGKGRAR